MKQEVAERWVDVIDEWIGGREPTREELEELREELEKLQQPFRASGSSEEISNALQERS